MANILGAINVLDTAPAAIPTAMGNPPDVVSGGLQSPSIFQSEREIARLTWLVLDGNASASDRRLLADLVTRQHALRSQAG